MKTNIVGNKSTFAVAYSFLDDTHETELSMFINGNNILAFEKEGKIYTTRWNLDELVFWMRDFIDHMTEDPYPVQAEGEYAAIKDISARDYDSDDEEEFDAYYDKLDAWDERHRWHTASAGAILSDVYFQLAGNYIEISWNNEDAEDNVRFLYQLGGEKVEKKLFLSVTEQFIKNYALHWFQ